MKNISDRLLTQAFVSSISKQTNVRRHLIAQMVRAAQFLIRAEHLNLFHSCFALLRFNRVAHRRRYLFRMAIKQRLNARVCLPNNFFSWFGFFQFQADKREYNKENLSCCRRRP